MAERKVLFQGAHASLVIANSSSIADNQLGPIRANPRRSELKSVVAGKHVSLKVARSTTTTTDDASQPQASPQVMCTAAALDALIPLDERHHHWLGEGDAVLGGRHLADPCPVDAEASAARLHATPLVELPRDTAVVWAALADLADSAPGDVSGPPDGNCTCGCVRVLRELLEAADGMPPGSMMASVVADPTLLDPDASPSVPRSARHSGLPPAAAFAGGGGGGGVQVVGPTTLSTRCPISRAALKLPAVLCGCRHDQPFDALVALHAAITEHRTRAADQRPSLLLTPYEQYTGSGMFVSPPDNSPGGGAVIVGGGAADGSTLITPSTLAVACPVCGVVASALALRVSPPLTEALRQLGPSYETIRVPPCTEPGVAGAGGHLLWDAARIDMGVLVAAAAHGETRPRHSVASVGSSSSQSELPLSAGF